MDADQTAGLLHVDFTLTQVCDSEVESNFTFGYSPDLFCYTNETDKNVFTAQFPLRFHIRIGFEVISTFQYFTLNQTVTKKSFTKIPRKTGNGSSCKLPLTTSARIFYDTGGPRVQLFKSSGSLPYLT